MTCSCTRYEPGLISYVDPECQEHGRKADERRRSEQDKIREKLKSIGITSSDLRKIGWIKNGRFVGL